MSQSIEDQHGPLDPDFDALVMKEELAHLSARSSAGTRSQSDRRGLPDFSVHLDTSETPSALLQGLLEDLADADQSRLWKHWAEQAPEHRHGGLTGLAFSGGGIRSSTLNLGIVQVMHRLGLFKCLDYLSTVSGGGYLGSSITAAYAGGPEDAKIAGNRLLKLAQERFPYQHEAGRPEPGSFLQLRNYARFLAPRGLVDYLRLPVLLLRGLVLNFLVFLPWLLGLALVTRALLDPARTRQWIWFDALPGPDYVLTATWLGGGLLVLVMLFPLVRKLRQWTEGIDSLRVFRGSYERVMTWAAVLVAVSAWVDLQPLAIAWLSHLERPGWLTGGVGGVSAAFAMLGRIFTRKLRSLAARYALYLVALVGFLAFWLVYALLCTWLISSPPWWQSALPGISVAGAYAALMVGLGVYSLWLIDANGLSLHNFYRDKLAEAFLFRVTNDGSVEHVPDLKLSELSNRLGPLHLFNTAVNTNEFPQRFRKGRHSDPFFLSQVFCGSRLTGYCHTSQLEADQQDLSVSTAVATSGAAVSPNMGRQTRPVLRVILSVLNIRLGYWLVNPYSYRLPAKRLQYAIGRRLRVGVVRYLQELTGWLNYERSYVYLSDGGHIDNMGIYPLVQRQCRLIIVGDGECDPAYTFAGLMDIIRIIRIDFGVHIEMHGLDAIRNGQQHYGRGIIHYPGGRKGYLIYLKSSLPGDDTLEAAVAAKPYVWSHPHRDLRYYDYLSYIATYKATHPTFPHETTADQFFDEAQFECYRALGYWIAEAAFLEAAEPAARSAAAEEAG